tara:strand:- start:12749 stop:13633 length:885 start_codon:yes stop_codon:yes gene_type:complete
MPAVEITDTKGLIQKTGTGVTSSSSITLTAGLNAKDAATTLKGDSVLIVGAQSDPDAYANPFEQSATQLFPMGTKLQYGDRTFRYAFSGEANNAGVLIEGAALTNPHHRNIAVQAATTAGDRAVSLTKGATAITLNQFADGYLHINDDTADVNSQGGLYRIKSHAAKADAGTLAFVLYDPIPVVVPTTGIADLIKNIYTDVVKTATTPVSSVLGVTPMEIANDRYFWLQTGGPASVLCADAAPTIGEPVTRNTATAGSVQATAGGADNLNDNIGRCIVTNGTGDNIVIQLNLDT